jgi:ligand-binding SRPBCC domain-containing protein
MVTELSIPIPLEDAWEFFSSPLNLAKITPGEMQFTITSPFTSETKMYPGMIITYVIKPVLGIKMNWMTEITHVSEHEYFVDEQRFGPYALWHHEHHFKRVPGGVQMTDILNYAMPYGALGTLTNKIFVKKQVEKIFKHREKAIIDLFGAYKKS